MIRPTCRSCGAESVPGMKFCGQCGSRLEVRCPQCDAEVPASFNFCGQCGAAVKGAAPPPTAGAGPQPVAGKSPAAEGAPPPAPAPAASPAAPQAADRAERGPRPTIESRSYTPHHLESQVLGGRTAIEGERKLVTVLFCDVVESTAMAERIGAEDMHALLSHFFELALETIHGYAGTVNQFLGDGFMALFGAPIAHEDHSRRAVSAALDLRDRLLAHGRELGVQDGVGLEIRMGINAGPVVVGSIGDDLRMDYTAVGDTTNLAARLQQHAEPGSILISEPVARVVGGYVRVEAVEPLSVKGKAEPVRAFRVIGLGDWLSSQAALAGQRLSRFVGRGREVATLNELVALADSGQGRVVGILGEAGSGKSRLLHEFRYSLWGRKIFYLTGRCLSYGGETPYLPLSHMLRAAWHLRPGDDPQVIAARVDERLSAIGMHDPSARAAILHVLGVQHDDAALDEMSPQALQNHIRKTFLHMLGQASHQRLVILEIEDLHWADEASLEILTELAEKLAGMRLLLVLTYRQDHRPTWLHRSYATQLTLQALTGEDSLAVFHDNLDEAKLDPEVVDRLLQKADGNPFFLEELARTIAGRTIVAGEEVLPETIQDVLLARIDRLNDLAKSLLQTASVIGRELPGELLEHVWEGAGDFDAGLRTLRENELLLDRTQDDIEMLFFRHALTREVVYETLLRNRRKTLHGAVAKAIETRHADRLEEYAADLAIHYSQSADDERAIHYLKLSARLAARSYAHGAAAASLTKALDRVNGLPEPVRDATAVEIVLLLTESLYPLAQFRQSLELLLAHRERVDRLGDPRVSSAYDFWLAHTYSYMGDHQESLRAASRASAAAVRCGDLAILGRTRFVEARGGFWSGQCREALARGEEAAALLQETGETWWEGQTHWVNGMNSFVLGEFDNAFESLSRAHAIGERLDEHRLLTSWHTGFLHAMLGEHELSIAECRRGLEESREPLNTGSALGFLGYAYLMKGDSGEAVRQLEEALAILEPSGIEPLIGWFSAYLGEALCREGRLDEAEAAAERGRRLSESRGFSYGLGLAQRALGRTAAARGDEVGATRWLRCALATFDALEARFEAERTREDLVSLASTA